MYGRRFGQAARGLFAQQPWLCNGRLYPRDSTSPWFAALGKPPIDNNPTPSYLSLSFGCLPLARRDSRRICPKSAAFRSAGSKSGRGGV